MNFCCKFVKFEPTCSSYIECFEDIIIQNNFRPQLE